MKIGFLGAGAWGFCLANLLAENKHQVTVWSIEEDLIETLKKEKEHPKYPGFRVSENMQFTHKLEDALQDAEILVESVTTKGFRPVLSQILKSGPLKCPLVLTSKGIEQKTGLLLPEIAIELGGEAIKNQLVCLSGPSLAKEVMYKYPTSVVSASWNKELRDLVAQIFGTSYFRVYPNDDLMGVAFGGAMKNIIAIACGISDGLDFGQNSKAALMTRGLHEMKKLAHIKGAKPETLSGLAGLGDLCVTCLSILSRNYLFGKLIGEGVSVDEAMKKIKMVVEGANTCVSARELGRKENIPLPITEVIYSIIYENLEPSVAVESLLKREVKEELL